MMTHAIELSSTTLGGSILHDLPALVCLRLRDNTLVYQRLQVLLHSRFVSRLHALAQLVFGQTGFFSQLRHGLAFSPGLLHRVNGYAEQLGLFRKHILLHRRRSLRRERLWKEANPAEAMGLDCAKDR